MQGDIIDDPTVEERRFVLDKVVAAPGDTLQVRARSSSPLDAAVNGAATFLADDEEAAYPLHTVASYDGITARVAAWLTRNGVLVTVAAAPATLTITHAITGANIGTINLTTTTPGHYAGSATLTLARSTPYLAAAEITHGARTWSSTTASPPLGTAGPCTSDQVCGTAC